MAPRVLMFGWEFPPHNSGGLGTACYGLTKALAGAQVPVTFVLPRRLGTTCDFMSIHETEISGVELLAVNAALRPYITSGEYVAGNHDGLYRATLYEEVQAYGQKAREIATNLQFDVVHAHDWLSAPAGSGAREVSDKPLVLHVHATEFDRTGGTGVNEAVFNIEKNGMQEADQVVAVSERTKSMVVKYYGIKPEKIAVVYNGIDIQTDPVESTELEALKRTNKIVLFVGRITLQKGPDYFIAVAKRLLEYRQDVYFVVAGSGDMEGQMINDAARAGISDKIIFAGFARGRELDALYRLADVYVLPSVSEPFGITPLESLAQGTPVLVSRQSGVSEVVSHCLKTDFWDIDEMANQINAVLSHDALRATLAQNGFAEAKGLTWDKAAAQCRAIYQKLCPHLN